MMIPRRYALSACTMFVAAAAAVSSARAAGAKDYQVTGSITAVTDTVITVVGRGDEKFEINRTASTKGGSGLKVGDKVTVYYSMTASSIESKAAPAAAASPAAASKKGAPAPSASPKS